jgi:SAM-dependent methyltransferase
VRHALYRVYWWLERRLAPGLRYAQLDFEEVLFSLVSSATNWLDLGCGHTLLPDWRAVREKQLASIPNCLIGLDSELSALRQHRAITRLVCADGARLPFADAAFDLVSANMVVEHLEAPATQFREVARILRPGGRFVFHTPNAWGYPTLLARLLPDGVKGLAARVLEGRADDDRFKTFYRANGPALIEPLAKASGFAIETLAFIRSTATFALVPPLAVPELLVIRALGANRLRRLRPNLIAVLVKRGP